MNNRNPFDPPQSPVADPQPSTEANPALISRPGTIDLAFWLIAGSAALGVLSFLVRGMREQALVVFMIVIVLVGIAALIRVGKNWARIVYAVLFVIGLPTFLFARELIAQNGVLFFVIFCLQTVLQGYAVWLVFRPPGSRWFKRVSA